MACRCTVGPVAVAAVLFLAFGCRAQNLDGSYLTFLQKHGVPCRAIQTVGTRNLDYSVTCDDGREWLLFWLENEVALVRPDYNDLYRWRLDTYQAFPSLYPTPKRCTGLHTVDLELPPAVWGN